MGRLNKWTFFVAMTAALAAVVLFATAGSAQAQPTVVIETFEADQATDLVDGQTINVTIDGAGGRGIWWVGQCANIDSEFAACNQAFESTGQGLLNGHTTTVEIVVSLRFSSYDGVVIDCLQVDCGLRLYSVETPSEILPITFDPEAPRRSSASLTAAPVSDLDDGATVTFTGEGFQPFDRIDVSLCRQAVGNTPCDNFGALVASLEGDVSSTIDVPRTIVDFESALVDCAVTACELRFGYSHENHDDLAPTPIAVDFHGEEPLPEPSTATARPRRNLVDGQTVTVRMVDPDVRIWHVQQCGQHPTAADESVCQWLDSGHHDQERDVQVEVRRFLPLPSPNIGLIPPIDCAEAPGRCELLVRHNSNSLGAVVDGGRGLVFDPNVPTQTTTVRLKGRNKIVPNTVSEISFANNQGTKLWVVQCPRDATDHQDQRCVVTGSVRNRKAQASGVIQFRPRTVVGSAGDLVDCSKKKACDLRVVGTNGLIRRLLINLVGEPSDLPTIRVSTKRDLVDGQQVKARVAANGYRAVVQQCVVGSQRGSGYCVKAGNLNSRGFLTTTVRRFVQSVDCAAAPRVCELRVSVDNVRTDGARLIFEPVAPVPTGVLAASASEGVIDGQSVELTVRGHGPSGHHNIFQCATGLGLGGCREAAYFWQSDDPGASTTAQVTLQQWIGTNDCASSPGACQLVTGDYSGVTGTEKVDLTFADGSKSFSVRPRRNLVDQQIVSVTADLPEGHRVVVSQCLILDGELAERACGRSETLDVPRANATQSVGADQSAATLTTTTGITRKVDFTVRRLMSFSYDEPAWDCAAEARSCGLNFTVQAPYSASYEPESVKHFWLDFQDLPLPELGKVTVRPRRNLEHLQTVAVTAEIPDESHLEFSQCRLVDGEVDDDSCARLASYYPTEAGGSLQQDVEAPGHPQWQTPGWLEQEPQSIPAEASVISASNTRVEVALTVSRFLSERTEDTRWDCASVPRSCALVVQFYGDQGFFSSKQVWLEFDDVAFKEATFSVSPRRNLAPNQQVDVRLENSEAELYGVLQCARDADRSIRLETCFSLDFFDVGFGDEASATVSALGSLRDRRSEGPSEVINCVGAVPACVMVLYPGDAGLPQISVALSFNGSRDALPIGPTTLYATPNVGLTIGTTVTVSTDRTDSAYYEGELCTGDRFDLLSVRCDVHLPRVSSDDDSVMFEFMVEQAMVEFCDGTCFVVGFGADGQLGTSDYLQFEPQ